MPRRAVPAAATFAAAALACAVASCVAPRSAAAGAATDSAMAATSPEAAHWWQHVRILAADDMRGRQTGSVEHRLAAEYVAGQFKALGLEPGADGKFFQPVRFVSRRVRESECSLALVFGHRVESLVLGQDATLQMSIDSAPEIEASVVFVGYGISVPEQGYDDLAKADLKGKIALYFQGGPASVTEPRRSQAQFSGERWAHLRDAGAIGAIVISNPHHADIPWLRGARNRFNPGMSLADSAVDERRGQRLGASINPDRAAAWFEGSPHRFAELLALADSERALPGFPLAPRVRARVRFDRTDVESQNVVAILPGRDAKLASETMVLSAHLDHLGVGAPVEGDSIYNGAMDNASGVSELIEIARGLAAPERRPARSIVFVCTTGEEKGLLGAYYYSRRPTVPTASIVANLNVDEVLPIVPMDHLLLHGVDESTLGDRGRTVAAEFGIEVVPDPEPWRNLFIRSDQFNFIRIGVPALAPSAAAVKGSTDDAALHAWTRERYHQPSDDLDQPLDASAVTAFIRWATEFTARVANDPVRPEWKATSFFKRYASPPSAP